MAYDMVVDAAKLDGARTATADAIREKLEDDEEILWDEETGFADDILAIELGQRETITIVDDSLTNSSNYDLYFGGLIDGWGTEPILLFMKDWTQNLNKLVGGFSEGAYRSNTNTFDGIFRYRNTTNAIQRINREDWVIRVYTGDEYNVIRLGETT